MRWERKECEQDQEIHVRRSQHLKITFAINNMNMDVFMYRSMCKEPKRFAYRWLLCKTSSRSARNILDNVTVFYMSMVGLSAFFLVFLFPYFEAFVMLPVTQRVSKIIKKKKQKMYFHYFLSFAFWTIVFCIPQYFEQSFINPMLLCLSRNLEYRAIFFLYSVPSGFAHFGAYFTLISLVYTFCMNFR